MQFARVTDVTLHYQVIGNPAEKPAVVFANSLGTDLRIWRDVAVRLADRFALLMYDKRGHGLSDVGDVPYTMPMHAADLAALMDHTRFRPALIVGSSVGGLIAQQLYQLRPDLVRGLLPLGIAHKVGTPQSWAERLATVAAHGIEGVADKIVSGWFTPAFRTDVATVAGYRNMLTRTTLGGYLGTVTAIRDTDFTTAAPNIRVPTLVVTGESDATTPPALAAEFARMVPGARFEVIKHAAHIPCVEQPDIVSELIRALAALAGTETASHVSH